MRKIIGKEECCGCAACVSVCPKQCISMEMDRDGFYYPQIEEDRCINCGKCNHVCPVLDYEKPIKDECSDAYAVQLKDKEALLKCASGGAYSGIAKYVINQNGCIVGAAFDDEGNVVHTIIFSEDDIHRHGSSKYVQSYMSHMYEKIEKLLLEGKMVLYSGTPCQVVALKKYLHKEYANLICVDLLCAGVMSQKVFDEYKEIMRNKYNSQIMNFNFKRKTYGYHSSTMAVTFADGRLYSKSRLTDPLMWCYTNHIADRPSCAKCKIKGTERLSDLTIFDCWHYETLSGKKDNDLGHTNVLVHTKKGKEVLKSSEEYFFLDEVDRDECIKLDGNMTEGIQKHHPKREDFFDELDKNGLQGAINKCIPIQRMNYIKEASKGILYRTGLLEIVKRIGR